MSAASLSEWALVGLGVAIELACSAGLLLARTAFDRLHFAAAASTAGPAPIAAAVVVRESFGQPALDAVLVAILLLVLGPLLTIASFRAIRLAQFGQVEARPEEIR